MGYFSWLKADNLTTIANIVNDKPFKMLIPKEFGGGFIRDKYQGYGLIGRKKDGTPKYDMYELLAFWNASEDESIKEELRYDGEFPSMKEIDEYTHTNRAIGIDIGCYQEEIDRLRYPLKLVSTTFNGTYEDCNGKSYGDPNQGVVPKKRSKEDIERNKQKEREQQQKEQRLREIRDNLIHINDPTYYFKPGDEVVYGAMEKSVVREVLFNGKAYCLECLAKEENYGNPYLYTTERLCYWMDIRPLPTGNTNFATKNKIRISFLNTTIESLIFKFHHFGIDMNPAYQRDYVWDDADKEYLLDSIFQNIDIGKFALICHTEKEWAEKGYAYEILDGKQRLQTLVDFYENRFSYRGKYYNDLGGIDKYHFNQFTISVGETDNMNTKDTLEYFLRLNRAGKTMNKEQLNHVEQLLLIAEDV